MTRVALWVGRSGPGRASAGGLVDPEGADAETVRRAVLACGTALAADRLAAAAPDARGAVIRAFGEARPDDLVDLTGACTIGGLAVGPPGGMPPPGAAIADLVLAPGDDADDANPRVMPGDIAPEEAAALAAAAIARALPRDPLHLGRTGAALRSIAREATLSPETLPGLAAGIAATARDPDAVRMFTDPDRDRPPDDDRRGMRLPDGRTATIAAAGAIVAGAVGLGIAGLLVWWLDPATANRGTALVAGAIIGALIGSAVAVRLVRSRR
jgi:hypothetical protein